MSIIPEDEETRISQMILDQFQGINLSGDPSQIPYSQLSESLNFLLTEQATLISRRGYSSFGSYFRYTADSCSKDPSNADPSIVNYVEAIHLNDVLIDYTLLFTSGNAEDKSYKILDNTTTIEHQDSCSGDPTDAPQSVITCAIGGYIIDALIGWELKFTSGIAVGKDYLIVDNTADTITIDGNAYADGARNTDTFDIINRNIEIDGNAYSDGARDGDSFEIRVENITICDIGEYKRYSGVVQYIVRGSDDVLYKYDTLEDRWEKMGTLNVGGDRTTFLNFKDRLLIFDGYNFKRWDGITLEDVPNNPPLGRYGIIYEDRVFIGNLDPSGSPEPNAIWFSAILDEEVWTSAEGTVDNKIMLNNAVMGFGKMYDSCIVLTDTTIERLKGSMGVYQLYYFPERIQIHDKIGCDAPFSIVSVLNDLVFMNRMGIYSVGAVEKYGDLEKARLSYDIDNIFSDLAPLLKYVSAQYIASRDEYWISLPTNTGSNQTDRIYILKFSIRTELNRFPWMPQGLSFSCLKHLSNDQILFGGYSNGKVYSYRGDKDEGEEIEAHATSADLLRETMNRKRLILGKLSLRRNESSEGRIVLSYFLDGKTDSSKSFHYYLEAVTSVSRWGSAVWGVGKWSASGGKYSEEKKNRISRYCKRYRIQVKWISSLSQIEIPLIMSSFVQKRRI